MKKDTTRNRCVWLWKCLTSGVWPWKGMIGGVCVLAALVIGFGMRGLDNPDGWPEGLVFPALAPTIVGGVLVYAEWREGSL